jgi:hypothetical protein
VEDKSRRFIYLYKWGIVGGPSGTVIARLNSVKQNEPNDLQGSRIHFVKITEAEGSLQAARVCEFDL